MSTWRRFRPDPYELALLALLGVVSAWVLGLNLWQIADHGRAWTGTDGAFPIDQLQYLAWIRDASVHVLASDLFVVRATAHDYLEPLVALAGGLTALGIAPWLALLLFQPLAVLALFVAAAAWCRALLTARWQRLSALALALFFGSFGVLGDEWPPFLTWGYLPAVFAIAAMTGALIAYERSLRSGRELWIAPLLGLFASWLHPWQGAELILIVAAVELTRAVRPARVPLASSGGSAAAGKLLLPATVIASALPLAYYVLLDRLDPTWRLAGVAGAAPWPFGKAIVPLLPLIVAAVPAWLKPPDSFLGAAARAWPPAILVVYLLTENGIGGGPLHAFSGVTLPLAVLAVEGVSQFAVSRRRWLMALLVAALTIPATAHMLVQAGGYVAPSPSNHNFIAHGEQRALAYLAADRQPGGVLAPVDLGAVVPAATGRPTYVGDCYWSLPDCRHRAAAAWSLFYRPRSPGIERSFVSGTGVRFVLAPCGATAKLGHTLRPLIASVHRFGCGSVYTLR